MLVVSPPLAVYVDFRTQEAVHQTYLAGWFSH